MGTNIVDISATFIVNPADHLHPENLGLVLVLFADCFPEFSSGRTVDCLYEEGVRNRGNDIMLGFRVLLRPFGIFLVLFLVLLDLIVPSSVSEWLWFRWWSSRRVEVSDDLLCP